jgi:hypothetical protein
LRKDYMCRIERRTFNIILHYIILIIQLNSLRGSTYQESPNPVFIHFSPADILYSTSLWFVHRVFDIMGGVGPDLLLV